MGRLRRRVALGGRHGDGASDAGGRAADGARTRAGALRTGPCAPGPGAWGARASFRRGITTAATAAP